MITLDIVEIVQACPVLRVDADENEVGEDCAGCAQHDPDRADLCARMFRGEQPEMQPGAIFEPGEILYAEITGCDDLWEETDKGQNGGRDGRTCC